MICATALALLVTACSGGSDASPYLTTLGDSITHGVGASSPHRSYAALLAKAVGGGWTNLGIVGETLIPEPNAVFTGRSLRGGTYKAHAGVLADEVPRIPLQTTIVTLYIGTNDLWMGSQAIDPDLSNASSVLPRVESDWRSSYASLITAIRTRVPRARIIVATNINPADKGSIVLLNTPAWTAYRIGLSHLVNAMNGDIVSSGVTVVDLHCDARLYDAANYATQYDVHPNDAGHQAIYEDFLNAMLHPASSEAPCKYDAVLATLAG